MFLCPGFLETIIRMEEQNETCQKPAGDRKAIVRWKLGHLFIAFNQTSGNKKPSCSSTNIRNLNLRSMPLPDLLPFFPLEHSLLILNSLHKSDIPFLTALSERPNTGPESIRQIGSNSSKKETFSQGFLKHNWKRSTRMSKQLRS